MRPQSCIVHTQREIRPTPAARFEMGCIATLIRDGETRARHFTGNGSEAVRAVAEFCDLEGWRVLTLSTPSTVYRDLDGTREEKEHDMGRNHITLPEESMLSRIGRLDLWAR